MTVERDGFPIPGDALEAAIGRIVEALAVLETIEDAGLLDALPAAMDARAGHQRAVSLLAVLRRDLKALTQDLEAASTTATLLSAVISRRRPAPK